MPSATSRSRSRARARTVNRGSRSSSRSYDATSSTAAQPRSETCASTSASRSRSGAHDRHGATSRRRTAAARSASRRRRRPARRRVRASSGPAPRSRRPGGSRRPRSALSRKRVLPGGLEVERVDEHQQRLPVQHAGGHDVRDPLMGLLRGPAVDDAARRLGVGVVDQGQQVGEVRLPGQTVLTEQPVGRGQLDPLGLRHRLTGIAHHGLDLLAGPPPAPYAARLSATATECGDSARLPGSAARVA